MCKSLKGYYWKCTGEKKFIFSSQPIKLQAHFKGEIMYMLTVVGSALKLYRNTNIVRLS